MRLLLISLTALLMVACSSGDEFEVSLDIKGLAEEAVTMRYLSNGDLVKIIGHAKKGQVELTGSTPEMTLVEIAGPDNEPLCAFAAKAGDEIEITGSLNDPEGWQLKGTQAVEDLSTFIKDNKALIKSRDYARLNSVISKFISSHPESGASGVLLATRFHSGGYEALGDSLMRQLKGEARLPQLISSFGPLVAIQKSASAEGVVQPMTFYTAQKSEKDTICRFAPEDAGYSLLAVTTVRRGDSVVRQLKTLPKSVRIIEIAVGDDSLSWKQMTRGDSSSWFQAWLPGGTANPQIRRLAIPQVPYFITVDSLRRQVYRGSSLTRAVKAASEH